MLKKIVNLFRKQKAGSIYAFSKGMYAAKMFVLIQTNKKDLDFLILPDNLNITLKKSEFFIYNKTKECEFVEILPDFVFDVCKAQYSKCIRGE